MKPNASKKDTLKNGESSDAAKIADYTKALPVSHAAICGVLQREIQKNLPKASAKFWHAAPVWFVGENPVVGYKAAAKHINVLFWSGQSFGDSALKPVGKFKAAQIQFGKAEDIDLKSLRGWLKKSGKDIWDYRGHFEAHKAARSKKKS